MSTETNGVGGGGIAPTEPTVPGIRPSKVISLGEIMVGIMMDVHTIPQPGGYAAANRTGMDVSGVFPVLQAVSRMGVRAEYAGIIGNGPWATIIRDALEEADITHIGYDRLDEDSGFRVAVSDGGPRKTLIAQFGAEAHGDYDSFDMVKPGAKDVVHVSGNALTNRTASAVYAFLRREDEHWSDFGGVGDGGPGSGYRYRIVFQPSGAVFDHMNEALIETLVLDRPIWTCNKREARLIANRLGVPLTEPEPVMVNGSTTGAMPELCEGLGEVLKAPLVIRTGSTGAWVWEPDKADPEHGTLNHIPGYPTKAVHTQSAGSCHTGVLCAMLSHGYSLPDATRIANAASSLAVSRASGPTGAPECPAYPEALQLAETEPADEN